MADNVEGLVIEIESQAQGAVSQLDMLNERLEGLKKLVSSSASLATFSKNFQAFTNSFNVGGATSNLTQYAQAIEKISAMSNFKLNKSGIGNLEYMAQTASMLGGEPLSNLERYAYAMERLSSISGFKLNKSVADNLGRIAEVAKQLDASSVQNLDAFTSALSRLQVLAEVDSKSVKELASSMKTFSSATRGATTRGRTFNTVLANIRTKTLAMYAGLTRVARGMTKSLSIYGDYVEALNLYKMAMGEAAEEGYAFAETAQKLLGIDLTQWMQAQGVFMALAKGFGVANDKAALMSQNLTQLAYDISSFYNISVEDAIQKVQSGFAGQIRPVRNLGYDLSQARLEAIALANGIDEEVKSMTQAEKSQLRYIALMTQLTEVQGDLARTLDSPTNQLRLLNAQLDQMMRSVGMVLLPMLNKIIPYLNAILRVIKMIAEEIAAMFGYTLPKISGEWSSNVSLGADELEEDLEDANGAAEKLKNTLASFDQINLITSKSGGSGSGSSSVGGSDLGLDLPSYDFLGDVSENKAQEIAEGMMRKLRPFVDWLKDTIMWTYNHIDDIGQLLTMIAVVTIGKNLIDNVMGAWKWFSELNTIVKGLGMITIGLQLSYLGGKDLAQGNILKGILESALGAAAAGYGGYLLLGPAGAVVGVSVALALTITSYMDQKQEQKLQAFKEHIAEVFKAFEEGKASLDVLTDSFGEFVKQYSNTEWLEKYSEDTRGYLGDVGISIANLQVAYSQGLIGTDYYVESISNKFGELKDTVLGYLDESRQAITDQLNGSLGAFLITLGYTQEEINAMLDVSTENITADMDGIAQMVADARAEFEQTGDIEKFQSVVDEAAKKMEEYYGSAGLMSTSVKEFNDSMEVLKGGINLDSLDSVLASIEQINNDYDTAIKNLHDERDKTVEYFNNFVAGMPPEMQARYQGVIDSVNTYFDMQESALKQGYADTMGYLENEGAGAWFKVFDTDGMQGVSALYEQILGGMGKSIDESFKKRKIDRNDSVFGQITSLINDTVKDVEKGNVSWSDAKRKIEEGVSSYRAASVSVDDYIALIRRFERNVPESISKGWKNAVNEQSKEGKKFADNGALIVEGTFTNYAAFSNKLPPKLQEAYDKMNTQTSVFGRTQKLSMQNAMSTVQQVISTSNAPEEMKRIMAKMNDAIKPDEFGKRGTSLKEKFMTGFKKDFTPVQTVNDFKDTLSRMLDGDDAKEWGVRIGDSIKTGMTTGLSGAETGVTYALNGAKQVLDQFGSASASYWSQMSKNIATVMSAIVANPTNPALKSTLSLILSGMKWTMKGFAKGGFPNSADFFYANENGVPEYIGTMGGRTAVANNAEITKGVADAVYKAIRDTGIANDVKKIASKDGKVVFAPSEEAGRVMSQSVNMYNATGGRY